MAIGRTGTFDNKTTGTGHDAGTGGFGRQIALEANELLGGRDAVLIFDESGFAKKGEASAGVARQWNGRLGKVDNYQVGVFATLCRGDMATLIDTRLYLPEDWRHDEARCKKAMIPKDKRQFFSKSQLALAMLEIARQRRIQFGYVGIDGGYGKEPAFLRVLMDRAAVSWPMYIAIKRFICKTLNR